MNSRQMPFKDFASPGSLYFLDLSKPRRRKITLPSRQWPRYPMRRTLSWGVCRNSIVSHSPTPLVLWYGVYKRGKVILAFRMIQLMSFISKVTLRSRKRSGRRSLRSPPSLSLWPLQPLLPSNSKWLESRTLGRQPPLGSSPHL